MANCQISTQWKVWSKSSKSFCALPPPSAALPSNLRLIQPNYPALITGVRPPSLQNYQHFHLFNWGSCPDQPFLHRSVLSVAGEYWVRLAQVATSWQAACIKGPTEFTKTKRSAWVSSVDLSVLKSITLRSRVGRWWCGGWQTAGRN